MRNSFQWLLERSWKVTQRLVQGHGFSFPYRQRDLGKVHACVNCVCFVVYVGATQYASRSTSKTNCGDSKVTYVKEQTKRVPLEKK